MATCAQLAQQVQVLSNLISHSHEPVPDLEAQLAAVRQQQQQQGCLKPATPVVIVKTKFTSPENGFQFDNLWDLDQYEKDKITDLMRAATVPALAALTPLLAPALGVVDVIGAIFGIPPGVVETVGAIALVSGGLNDMIDRVLSEPDIGKGIGLCGGMAFASLDYFNLNIPINQVAHPPRAHQSGAHRPPELYLGEINRWRRGRSLSDDARMDGSPSSGSPGTGRWRTSIARPLEKRVGDA
jgi:hypothetical protein